MADFSQLALLSKASSKAYHQQKAFIKKVLAGRIQHCSHCTKPLQVDFSEKGKTSIRCAKGCTDIELDCS